ncbi:glycosyltransferase family 1 protein [Collybia nuda]|uniref:UDP-N-acetylglucosamine transferase subunit ALG13 n=1 Tax=Collybia nuda TaxID=64659 RepID=A0A9P5YEH5_9AGAR|nr:glycosyltransferase family 1 protein [Collybia nuda]
MRAFLTVGSTKFDALVQTALSRAVLDSLNRKGYTELVIQCGGSDFELASSISQDEVFSVLRNGIDITLWRFKPSLNDEYERADIVISHAGSGTILDVLRLGKPLIVVPNPTLLHNHQEELAEALSTLGHLQSSSVSDLARAIETFDSTALVSFPLFDGSRFSRILDEEMGFK